MGISNADANVCNACVHVCVKGGVLLGRMVRTNARVGPHPLPTVALKNMACRTKGAFDTITAMGAIRTTIQVNILGQHSQTAKGLRI